MTASPSPSDAPDHQFVAARALLDEILRVPELENVFDLDDRPNTKMVYSQAASAPDGLQLAWSLIWEPVRILVLPLNVGKPGGLGWPFHRRIVLERWSSPKN